MANLKLSTRKCCALCQREEKLCKSHILSRFLVKGTYEEEGFAAVKSAIPGQPSYNSQGLGHWERLLCRKCEDRFGVWEDYSRDMLNDTPRECPPELPGCTVLRGIDYAKFKLFQMSLLWRVSVCRQSFYSRVSLGPIEEELRVMLLGGDPGKPWQFGCFMTAVLMPDGSKAEALVEPVAGRVNGYWKVKFVAGGYAWVFSVSRRPHSLGATLHLQESGVLIMAVRDLLELGTIAELADRVIKKELLEKVTKKPRMPSVLR